MALNLPAHELTLERLSYLVDASPHAVLMMNQQGTIVLINLSAARLFGYTRDVLIGQPVEILIPENFRALHQSLRNGYLAQPTTRLIGAAREILGLRSDGTEFPVEIGLNPVHSPEGLLIFASIVDLTNTRQKDVELRNTQALYKSLVESLPLNIFRKDREGRFQFANQRFCQTVQKFLWELIDHTDFDLFPAHLAEKYRRDDLKVIRTGEVLEAIEEHVQPDGRKFFVQVLKAPVRDAQDDIIGIQGMFWDVTARETAEQALHESEARKRAIFEAALDCMIIIDHDGKVVEFNPAAERTFGYSRAEVLGREMAELLASPDTRDRHRDSIQGYDQSRDPGSLLGRRLESPLLRKNGEIFLAEIAMQPIPLQSTSAFAVMLRDITERKRAEEALRQSNSRFRRLVDSDIVGIIIVQTDGLVTEANDAFLEMIGSNRQALLAQQIHLDQLTPPQYQQLEEQARDELAERGRSTPWEKELRRIDGSTVPVLIGMTLLDEKTKSSLGFVLDITKQKAAEAQLQLAKEAADAANRAKSVFLANMSHEIRTPMNAIIGMTELVLDTHLSPGQREYLEIVEQSAESLLAILNDVLDFSKIEAGKMDMLSTEFRLRDCIGSALKTLAIQAATKGLELVCDIRPDVPDQLLGDPARLRQVIVNLVGNALKFTDRGEVVVRFALETQSGTQLVLRGSVSDTGIGLEASQRERLFQAFEQVHDHHMRKYGGTGLGLAICSKLVDMLGGRIWAESEPGQGSTFHFTVQMQNAAPDNTLGCPSAPVEFQGARVLVVDDHPLARQTLKELLDSWGLQPQVVADASEALLVLQQMSPRDAGFSLALIDAQLGEASGFDFIGRLPPALKNKIGPVVMLLGGGQRALDLQRCEDINALAHVNKPVNHSELFDTVVSILAGQLSPDSDLYEARAIPIPATNSRILLVEDSLINQKLAVGLLEKVGHRVAVANNGKQAVEWLRYETPDIVLMDIQMPEMDGLEATRLIRLREVQSGEHLPIVAMTAQAMLGDRERCLDAGMDAYLVKPIRAQQLYDTIDQFLARKGIAIAAEEHAAMSTDDFQRVDLAASLRAVNGDQSLLLQIIDAFLAESPRLQEDMRAALESQNQQACLLAAHTLKGGVRTFGAETAGRLAGDIEAHAKAGKLTAIAPLWTALQAELSALQTELGYYRARH